MWQDHKIKDGPKVQKLNLTLTPPSSWGVDVLHAQFGFESAKLWRSKRLGENVCNLHNRADGQQFE